MSEQYVAAIDQGTTSTRCMIFNRDGRVVVGRPEGARADLPEGRLGRAQRDRDLGQHPRGRRRRAGQGRPERRRTSPPSASPTSARPRWCGTSTTGEPVYNAIVWQDTRTDAICQQLGALGGGADRYKAKVGLPLATYFSGPKVRWILDNVEGAREKAEAGDLVFGNMDTWVLWNMTGGVDGGLHITDPTNASRTMLMDLDTLSWDDEHRRARWASRCPMLPEIRSSLRGVRRGPRARARSPACRSPAILGDQQAATFGQACLSVGEAKNTYGTGNFMLINTGTQKVPSEERPAHHGLLQDRRPADRVRAGGLDRGDRLAGAVAARQPRA